MIYYRQCKLQKHDQFKTAFIPEQFAKKGKVIKIKYDDGWRITEIGIRLSEEVVVERSQDYKFQREASDV